MYIFQLSVHQRSDQRFLKSRLQCLLSLLHLCKIFHNRAIRIIMVQEFIIVPLNAVIQNGIPSFPDCCCSKIDAVHPSRIIFLKRNKKRLPRIRFRREPCKAIGAPVNPPFNFSSLCKILLSVLPQQLLSL